jgi:undecaprenyl pyrophosphate phosphatase UppP
MDISIFIPVLYTLAWVICAWVTGLILKNAGVKIKGGHIFLMLVGWGLAAVISLIGIGIVYEGVFFEDLAQFLLYGLIFGVIAGIVTIRQIAKVRKN